MPRNVKKENLPQKICVICNRPFTWRKKWEKVWDEVTCCSKSCNSKRRREKRISPVASSGTALQSHNDDDNSINAYLSDAEDAKVFDENDEDAAYDQISKIGIDGFSSDSETNTIPEERVKEQQREMKKARKKALKAERRARREGKSDDSTIGQKQCTVCSRSVDLLVRCTIDNTGTWHMVCGKCWHQVSGGVVDGDAKHPHYRYGGLWKNRAKR